MSEKNGDCGWKHLKLVGLVVVIVGIIVGAQWTFAQKRADKHETVMAAQEARIRDNEQANARMDERLRAIQETCERIERKLP